MPIAVVTPPAVEPVSTAEAKRHLRVESPAEDVVIASFIVAARGLVEAICGRALVSRRLIETRSGWPTSPDGEISLAVAPLMAVHEVRSIAANGVTSVLSGWAARSAIEPPRIVGLAQQVGAERSLAVEYTAGYGAAAGDVPAPLRHAVLLVTAALYEGRRGEAVLGEEAQSLLAPYLQVRL
jgi:uncharacterized phiE125 gp8 family phage protein